MRWISISLLVGLAAGCAMDAGPGLVLDHAWWRHPDVLRVALWTEAEGPFALEDASGRRAGDAACFASGRCVLTFEGAREPRRIVQTVSGRDYGAPLLECGPDDPFGLCPFGLTCVDRTCVPLCSAAHPDGACLDDGAVCRRGACEFEVGPPDV